MRNAAGDLCTLKSQHLMYNQRVSTERSLHRGVIIDLEERIGRRRGKRLVLLLHNFPGSFLESEYII